MTYEEFKATIETGISNGEVKLSSGRTLSELDLVIQYVISRVLEETGKPCEISINEMPALIVKYCGHEVLFRVLPN